MLEGTIMKIERQLGKIQIIAIIFIIPTFGNHSR